MTVLEDIRSRTHLVVVVRPDTFVEDRVPYEELFDVVRKASVQWRGWDFPHIDPRELPERDETWVGQQSSWNHHLEMWRIWTSGQFTSVSGFASEWRDRSNFWPPDSAWKQGETIGVLEVFLRFVEVFEFASRLALSKAGDESVSIDLTVSELEGRTLIMDDPRRIPFLLSYTATINDFPQSFQLRREDLVASPPTQAVQAARSLFFRFGLDMSEGNLQAALDAFNQQLGR